MDGTKTKITTLVQEYKKLFKAEYNSFLKSNAIRVGKIEGSNKFAEMKGSQQVVRHMIEVPETLYYAFVRGLSDNELDWLYSRNQYEKDFKGMKWFMESFPEFKVSKDF